MSACGLFNVTYSVLAQVLFNSIMKKKSRKLSFIFHCWNFMYLDDWCFYNLFHHYGSISGTKVKF